jgi:hypothetical protein
VLDAEVGVDVRRMTAVLALCAGCGASEVNGSGGDASPPDVAHDGAVQAAPDAHTCDPSILGDAGENDASVPTDGPYVVELAVASQRHQCARMSNGTVRCWGWNQYGLPGTGHAGDETCGSRGDACRTSPALVPGLTDVLHLAGNSFSICALRTDRSVWCWGALTPDGSPRPTPVRW